MDEAERAARERAERGREAEALAARWLVAHGFRVLDRNHRCPRGEVDLICEEGDALAFVEVRSRTSEAQGGPEETVGRRKARRVVAAATDWALRNDGLDRTICFHVVAVSFGAGAPRVELFRDAFDGDGSPGHW